MVEEHREAIERDLVMAGLRLRDWPTAEFNYRDLFVLIRQAQPGSAVYRAMTGEDGMWGLPEQLLAAVADRVEWLVWMQSSDAPKGRNKPRPIPRPA